MKYLIILSFLLLPACAALQNTPTDLVASKCRLHVPVRKADCEAAGVHVYKDGQIKGLPVSEMETGKTTIEIMAMDTDKEYQFLK